MPHFWMAMASSPSKPSAVGTADGPAVFNRSSDVSEPSDRAQSVENTLESNNRGLKRNASAPVPPMDDSVESCMLSELPEVALAHSMSFQAQKDRLSLATTCNDSLKKVEAFSRRALEMIRKNADDTWEARIRDPSSIETEIPHELLELPRRYLLSKAYQTHLYMLSDVPDHLQNVASDSERDDVVVSVGCEPSTRLSLCLVWDLSTKTCIGRFTIPYDLGPLIDVKVCGDLILCSIERQQLNIYTLGGVLLRTLEDVWGIREIFPGQSKSYFASDGYDGVWSLDPATDDILGQLVFDFPSEAYHNDIVECVESQDMLVILRHGAIDNDGDAYNFDLSGIYVVDLNDGSQKDFFPGCYKSFVHASDENSAFAATDEKNVDLLSIKDGRVSSTTAFTSLQKIDEIWFFSQSQGFVVCEVGRRINVYSAVNGELLQSITPPAPVHDVSITDGRVLFLIFDTQSEDNAMDLAHLTVGAYCLPWYKIEA